MLLLVNLPLVNLVHPKSDKLVTGVKNKATGGSKRSESTDTMFFFLLKVILVIPYLLHKSVSYNLSNT